jgi:hypothetical protein
MNGSPSLPRDFRAKATLLLSTPVAQNLCTCEHVLTNRTRVHCRTLLRNKIVCCSSRSVSNAYPDKEGTNNTKVHQLVTKFLTYVCLQGGGGHFQHLM